MNRVLLAGLLAGEAALYAALPAGKYIAREGYVIEVTRASSTEIIVKLSGSYRMNTCDIETSKLAVKNGTAEYRPLDDRACRVEFRFPNRETARVRQVGNCGCGLNVNLSGIYKRSRR